MNKTLVIFVVIFTTSCATTTQRFGSELPGPKKHKSFYSNSVVRISPVNEIDSGLIHTVKNAYFIVNDDVKDNSGRIIIRKNESVSASISLTHPTGVGRPAKMLINFQETKDFRGMPVYFNPEPIEMEGYSRRTLSLALTFGMFFVYPPFNFFHLMQKGSDVYIPKEHIFFVKIY